MVCTPAALLSRAASLLAFIVLSFSSIVPISALAANARETSGHWSLQPLKAKVVTRTSDATSPIDVYITARLATNGLALTRGGSPGIIPWGSSPHLGLIGVFLSRSLQAVVKPQVPITRAERKVSR